MLMKMCRKKDEKKKDGRIQRDTGWETERKWDPLQHTRSTSEKLPFGKSLC